ncbi:hypothetical protein [Pectobacterium brasiliense]|uniref:hypothetical protein n=1 Tax=Pectobacterium brasiliense TaxID=180957 RepID=UPI001968E608|nr:hypothetical protein [Pectobacterium brasiliense]MBN3056973.1 hypothetical protein [Pectobacterium brasiliense]
MEDSNKFKITYLELVFPPVSNQETFDFKDQPAAKFMRESDFYMIGGKAEAQFDNIQIISNFKISLEIISGEKVVSSGFISFNELDSFSKTKIKPELLRTGPKEIAITSKDDEEGKYYIIDRFTPENILWHRSRNLKGISGFDNFRDLMVYDLLYTGIAKVGDSYERLINKGHHARMNILSNEKQRNPGARVSDEIFIFLFKLQPLYIYSFGPDSHIDTDFGYDNKQIVADAEKAFVSLLKPEYNKERFKRYPQGKDGLYHSKLDSYAYLIAETLTFVTPSGSFTGGNNDGYWGFYNDADIIFTDKQTTTILTAEH